MMKKRILLSIITMVIIISIASGILVYRKRCLTGERETPDGRFDLYIYSISEENELFPYSPDLENKVIIENPPLIYFESLKNAYLYLFLFRPGNDMTIMFPYSNGKYPKNYRFTRYFLPENNLWEPYLQSTGEYSIYFIISTIRIKKVEKLLTQYDEYSRTGRTGHVKEKILADLWGEIGKYKRNEEWIKNTDAVPEWIGGTVRSPNDEVVYRSWSIPFRGIITFSITFEYSAGENNE